MPTKLSFLTKVKVTQELEKRHLVGLKKVKHLILSICFIAGLLMNSSGYISIILLPIVIWISFILNDIKKGLVCLTTSYIEAQLELCEHQGLKDEVNAELNSVNEFQQAIERMNHND